MNGFARLCKEAVEKGQVVIGKQLRPEHLSRLKEVSYVGP